MPCSGLRFLVVEDHEFQRGMLVRLLRSLGAPAVHAAADGEAALRIVGDARCPLDIVITDLAMPGMDGSELVRRLGAAGAGVALVLTSAADAALLASAGELARAGSVRLLGVVPKPLTAARLAPLLERFRAGGAAATPPA